MTARERLINSYANIIVAGKGTIDGVPITLRNAVALKVNELLEQQ